MWYVQRLWKTAKKPMKMRKPTTNCLDDTQVHATWRDFQALTQETVPECNDSLLLEFCSVTSKAFSLDPDI